MQLTCHSLKEKNPKPLLKEVAEGRPMDAKDRHCPPHTHTHPHVIIVLNQHSCSRNCQYPSLITPHFPSHPLSYPLPLKETRKWNGHLPFSSTYILFAVNKDLLSMMVQSKFALCPLLSICRLLPLTIHHTLMIL